MSENKTGFVELVTSFLIGWRRLTEEAERTLVDNLAATAPWLAPLAPAYLAYQAMTDVLRFPAWVAGAVGMTVEVLGISTINTALTFWTWNREKNKSDKAAPTWVAIVVASFYVTVVIVVNVLLDGGVPLEKWAKGLISSLSVAAAVTLALRSQHSRRMMNVSERKREEKAERARRKLSKVTEKVTEEKLPEPERSATYGKWRDWRKVPLEHRVKIYEMRNDVRQVMEAYGVSERTGYNWIESAEGDPEVVKLSTNLSRTGLGNMSAREEDLAQIAAELEESDVR